MGRLLLAFLTCLSGCAVPHAAKAAAADGGPLLPIYAVLAVVVLAMGAMLCFAWTLRNRLDRALGRLPADGAGYSAFLAGYTDLPLGLPRGTVRALLALIIVFGSVVFLAVSMAETANGATYKFPEALTGILGAILGFYFGKGNTGDDGQAAATAAVAMLSGGSIRPPSPTSAAAPEAGS